MEDVYLVVIAGERGNSVKDQHSRPNDDCGSLREDSVHDWPTDAAARIRELQEEWGERFPNYRYYIVPVKRLRAF